MGIGRAISVAVFVTPSYLKEHPAFISDLIIPLTTFTVVQLGTGKELSPYSVS